jgi:two-component system response regulator YesN
MVSHRPLLRERCLLDLVAGNSCPADFIEQARNLGIDLLAPWYQVLVVRAVLHPATRDTPPYTVCRQIDALLAEIIGKTDGVVSFKQGLDETILILKGETPGILARHAQGLTDRIRQRVAERTGCPAVIGTGEATERLGTIPRSFAQALAQISAGVRPPPAETPAPVEDPQVEQRHGALVAKARSYIDAHYADPDISLSQVAAQVLLSPTYFSVVFGREVGESFIEYLTGVRIRKAIELLRSTALTSSEIAYRIGYQNPRYFYSLFHKVVGQPPNEFRRSA